MLPSDLTPDQTAALAALLDTLPTENAKVVADLMTAATVFAAEPHEELDIKITASALSEMHDAFEMFRPYRGFRKVAVFGSARTRPEDPLYAQAREVARRLAEHDWMVITGAGPGIMLAAMEGAGRENSFGVTIRLPWEGGANRVIAGDSKLVSMKYFFTRKLMLIKESQGFICLPGGNGTMDETFELLTLTQTGKGAPVPIVFLDVPGSTYWSSWRTTMAEQLADRGYIDQHDLDLFVVTDSVDVAVAELNRFYANYHSIRWVGDRMVIRHRQPISDADLEALNTGYADILVNGSIERSGPMRPEVDDDDVVDLPRLVMPFDPRRAARLRSLIDVLNALV